MGDLSFRVLGPVSVSAGNGDLPLAGGRQRALLALLLVHAGEVVPVERLVDELWNGDERSRRDVQVLVSRLRRDLGAAARFERLAGDARRALAAGEHERALALADEALALWRGAALADVRDVRALQTEAERLEGLRLATIEDRADAALALGRADTGELERLVSAHPLRERLRAQLMLALYRDGRQAEALATYRDGRRALMDELGLEPGPALRELEQRILAHDPALGARPARTEQRRTSRRLLPTLALLLVLGVIVAVAATRSHHPRPAPLQARPDTVAAIDPRTGTLTAVLPVGGGPDSIAAVGGRLWVSNFDARTISRVDLRTHRVDTVGGLPLVDNVVGDGLGGVWVSSFGHATVSRLNPDTGEITRSIRIRSDAEGLAAGGGFLWVTSAAPDDNPLDDAVLAIDLRRMRVTGLFRVGFTPIFDAFGYGSAWVANFEEGTVSVIRPGVAHAETVHVADKPMGITTGEGGVWVVTESDDRVWRIDPITRRVVARIRVGGHPLNVAAGLGSVWVTNRDEGTVSRIDPRTNRVVATIRVGPSPAASPRGGVAPYGVAIAGGRVWVTVRHCDGPPCID